MRHHSVIEPIIGHVASVIGDWTGKLAFVATLFLKAQIYLAGKDVNDLLNYTLTTVSIAYGLIRIANEVKRWKTIGSDRDKK